MMTTSVVDSCDEVQVGIGVGDCVKVFGFSFMFTAVM